MPHDAEWVYVCVCVLQGKRGWVKFLVWQLSLETWIDDNDKCAL